MRQIRKLQPPTSLIQFRVTVRSTPGLTYNDYDDKQTLREQLVREQRGLCCYCLCSIQSDADSMKIEHWHSQSNYPQEALLYSNLLGSCTGNEGKDRDPRIQHCDTRKGNADIKWNPSNPDHRIESRIKYLADGTIFSNDTEFNKQINEVLNLNVAFLVASRKYVLDSFKQSLEKRGLPPHAWEKMLRDWNGESHSGDLYEYCQIVVYWMRKRISRI